LSLRETAPAQSDNPRTLTFACWGAAEEIAELRSRVVDPLNAEEERFRIQLLPSPGDYHTKLATMIAGDAAPDIFYLGQENVPAFATQGALLDLTEAIEADASPVTNLDAYYPSVLELYRRRGRMYGLPWIAQPLIAYCNAGLFEQAGVDLPTRDWQWDDFVATAEALTRDRDGDGRTDQWGFVLDGWPPPIMYVWQNGGEIFTNQGVQLHQPPVLEAFDFYAGLIHDEQAAPPLSVVAEMGFSELFRSGDVAIFIGGAADDLDRLPDVKAVAAEVPAGPAGERATFAWTAGLHVSAETDDPELAFEAWKRLLAGIQRWKVPAPRRDLAARLEEFEPRKAASADVIRASMEYMRAPRILPDQHRWDALFREEFLDPLLRTGHPAAEILEGKERLLEGWR
jgi:multiple sugar transport system substrate-binding protein